MFWKTALGIGLGVALAGSAAAANKASKLSLANAQGAQLADNELSICPEGQNWINLPDGTQRLCCPVDQDKIVLPDGTERACAAARPVVRKGLGFFGYSAIALAASGGAAAAAQNSNGRPASP